MKSGLIDQDVLVKCHNSINNFRYAVDRDDTQHQTYGLVSVSYLLEMNNVIRK